MKPTYQSRYAESKRTLNDERQTIEHGLKREIITEPMDILTDNYLDVVFTIPVGLINPTVSDITSIYIVDLSGYTVTRQLKMAGSTAEQLREATRALVDDMPLQGFVVTIANIIGDWRDIDSVQCYGKHSSQAAIFGFNYFVSEQRKEMASYQLEAALLECMREEKEMEVQSRISWRSEGDWSKHKLTSVLALGTTDMSKPFDCVGKHTYLVKPKRRIERIGAGVLRYGHSEGFMTQVSDKARAGLQSNNLNTCFIMTSRDHTTNLPSIRNCTAIYIEDAKGHILTGFIELQKMNMDIEKLSMYLESCVERLIKDGLI